MVAMSTLAVRARPESTVLPLAAGATGMTFVGGSVAVSSVLTGAPLFTVQALRYGVACLLLLAYARGSGSRLVRPRGTDWLWLLGVTVTGLVVFNVGLVEGAKHAEPAVLGVAVACVPLVLATLGPVLEGRGPRPAVLAGAIVVTTGAALVQGLGRSDAAGLGWAVLVFACEAGFTLLAVPVLGRHGPVGVSVHTTWLAAAMFALLGVLREGPAAITRLRFEEVLACAYLAVAVTAVAFVLWYGCVEQLGAGRTGLLTGVAPVAAALTGIALGGPLPHLLVWAGMATVAAGLALGLSAGRTPHRDIRSRVSGPARRFPAVTEAGRTEIRPADPADAAAIARIHMTSRATTMPYLPTQKRDHEQVTRWVEEVLLKEGRLWVAVCDGEILGYAALDADLLEHLYLRPDSRRQGIGTLLLDEVRRHSPDGLSLHVFQQNTDARAFYERHGFTVLDTSDGRRNMENLPDMTLRWTPDGTRSR
jgi:drug/metabolite transporter (DMT)-like permease/ribosomal protein S18 acetylase RimI-like enzyme